MTFDQFIELERVANRAVGAARVFARDADVRWLNELTSVMAELRHASMTLCDPLADPEHRAEASMRLHRLFTSV